MKRIFAVVAVGCAVAFASVQSAFAQPSEFRIGGVVFKFTLPAGYCEPRDKFIDVAQLVAATDNQNVTDLTAYQCSGGQMTVDAPLLIKTPKSVLMTDVDRPELMRQMGAVFDNPAFSAVLENGTLDDANAKSMSDVLGQSLTVKSVIKPIGKNETCAYLAGTIMVAPVSGSASDAAPGAVAACITSVKKRILLIYVYGPYSGPKSIIALAPKAKALALQLIAENP